MRPHGRFSVSQTRPIARATCDRCGFIYNHNMLNWQFDWAGTKLQNKRILVCRRCQDVPQEQLRTFVIPADPIPIMNPRPESVTSDNNPLSPIGTPVGTLIQYAGTNSAFNSAPNKPLMFSAGLLTSISSFGNSIGTNWGSSNAQSVNRFILNAPNDCPFIGSGITSYALEGSDTGILWTTIYSGTTAGTNGEEIDVTLTSTYPTTSYQYHQINFVGDGATTAGVAQCQFYVLGRNQAT